MNNHVSPKPKPKKIKAKHEEKYTPKEIKEVYLVDSPIQVDQGETVEIKLDCQGGFTVFFPKAGFFGEHVFYANDDEYWAQGEPAPEHQWWGVSLTRTQMKNPNKDNKELAYCIYSKDLDNFALGSSPPKMILKP